MRLIRAWSLVVALGAVNAGCSYNRAVPEAPLAVAGGPAAPFTDRWFLRSGRGLSLPLVVTPTRLYGVGIDRRVIAVDLERGRILWVFHLGGPSLSGVVVHHDTVIAGSERPGGEVFALTAATGRRVWKRSVGYVGAPLALVGDVVVAQTRNKGTIALDASRGATKWRLPISGGRVSALPGGAGTILLGTLDSLYRVEVATGRVEVRMAAPGTFATDWSASAQGIVAGTGEGEALLIDATTLAPRWRTRLDAPVLVRPTVVGDTAWIVTQANSLFQVDLVSGKATRILRHPLPVTAPPYPSDSALILGDARGILTAYERDGTVRWRIAVGRPVEIAPIEVGSDLLLFGGRGDVRRYSR